LKGFCGQGEGLRCGHSFSYIPTLIS
jgi:hypothetical protein